MSDEKKYSKFPKSPVTLITAAGFLLASAFSYNRDDYGGAVLATAGMILLGVWITLEVWAHRTDDVRRKDFDD